MGHSGDLFQHKWSLTSETATTDSLHGNQFQRKGCVILPPFLRYAGLLFTFFSRFSWTWKIRNKCKNWQLSNKKFGSRWRLSNTNGKFCIFWISFVMFWLILGLPCWVCFCHVFGQPLKKWRILKANPSKSCFLLPFWGSLKSLLFRWRFLDVWLGLLSAMVSFLKT